MTCFLWFIKILTQPSFKSSCIWFSRESVDDLTHQFSLKLADFGRKLHSYFSDVCVLAHVCSMSQRHSASPNYGWRKRFPEIEGTYKCNEQVIWDVRIVCGLYLVLTTSVIFHCFRDVRTNETWWASAAAVG